MFAKILISLFAEKLANFPFLWKFWWEISHTKLLISCQNGPLSRKKQLKFENFFGFFINPTRNPKAAKKLAFICNQNSFVHKTFKFPSGMLLDMSWCNLKGRRKNRVVTMVKSFQTLSIIVFEMQYSFGQTLNAIQTNIKESKVLQKN